MTVAAQTPFNSAVAAGSPTFAYNFRIIDQTTLVVKLDGVLKVLATDYTVTGVGNINGGTVVFNVTPTVGQIYTAQRVTPIARAIDYQPNGDLLSATVNLDYDALWLLLQEQAYNSTLTLFFPPGENLSGQLPPMATRANKFLAFDSTGLPIASAGGASSPVSVAMAPVVAASTIPASRALYGVAPRATRIDVASAATLDLTTLAPDTDDIRITGVASITLVNLAIGRVVRATAGGAFTLTNNASIVTNNGLNIICKAGDTFMLRATAANVVEVFSFDLAVTSILIDRALATYALNADITTAIPLDDTIPQISEGAQIISQSFTPKSTSSRIRVSVLGMVASPSAGVVAAMAGVFVNTQTDALKATLHTLTTGGYAYPMADLVHEYVPGTVSALTFSVRVGPQAGSTIRLNGNNTARFLGGSMMTTLLIEEFSS